MKDGLEKFFKEDKDSQIINRKKQTPKFTEEVIEYTKKYLKNIDDEIKGLPKLIEDFIHMVSRSFFDGFFEVIRHKFSKKKSIDHIEKLIIFYNSGWDKFII